MGMFASTLRRHIGNSTFDDLEERLLNALAGNVASDRWVIRLTGNFVNLVDVDDAALGTRHIKIGGLDET